VGTCIGGFAGWRGAPGAQGAPGAPGRMEPVLEHSCGKASRPVGSAPRVRVSTHRDTSCSRAPRDP
jgi:hypothetical protein